MDFASVLETVATYLEREKCRFALAGAVALQAYGLSRLTNDLDFVVDADVRPKLVPFLESLGYETLHASPFFSNHLHSRAEFGSVDFIYVRGETSDRIFAEARPVEPFRGIRILVPCPEHLAAMKAAAMKDNPARVFQDLADVRFLLTLPRIDRDRVRSYFVKFGVPEKFDELEATF